MYSANVVISVLRYGTQGPALRKVISILLRLKVARARAHSVAISSGTGMIIQVISVLMMWISVV